MWILNDAQNVAEGIKHRRDLDALPDVLNVTVPGRAQFQQPIERGLCIHDSPIHFHAAHAVGRARNIGIQTQFEATNIEADIKRLIEVRLDAENSRIPCFGLADVRRAINGRSEP